MRVPMNVVNQDAPCRRWPALSRGRPSSKWAHYAIGKFALYVAVRTRCDTEAS